MATARINLGDFRSEDKVRRIKAKVFTGRDRGQEVREKSKIDELEASNDEIIILLTLRSLKNYSSMLLLN